MLRFLAAVWKVRVCEHVCVCVCLYKSIYIGQMELIMIVIKIHVVGSAAKLKGVLCTRIGMYVGSLC